MDPEHTGDMLRHLEKQDKLLMDSYRSMSHCLHKLQVEEEMLMRKYYELMMAHGQIQKMVEKESMKILSETQFEALQQNCPDEDSELCTPSSVSQFKREDGSVTVNNTGTGLVESEASPNDNCNEK